MELKLPRRRLLALLVAAGAVLAMLLALTTSLSIASAKGATRHHHAIHHVGRAHAGQTTSDNGTDAPGDNVQSGAQSGPNDPTGADNEPTSSSGEGATTESDGPGGPAAGGDHQCPPACSPGEQG
jgi:hypothetical protein